jgi:uncharacterized membrane protein YdfJ with MMPL/SSD domain
MGHDKVHDDDVRFESRHLVECLEPVGSLSHDVDIGLAREESVNALPQDGVIVDEQHLDCFVVMLLAILFGLSMDYQVFLVSRMQEELVHTGDNEHAVTVGQATTGRVVTAAAAIMISVFLAFVFGGQRIIAEFGIGLAAAVFLDAAAIRTVLVPSLMHLFGRANWWLPKALDRRLPHLSVEPVEDAQLPRALSEPDTAAEAPLV